MNTHATGILVTSIGVLLVVPDSLFVRLIAAEPLTTSFWRGLTSGLIVLVFTLATSGLRGFRAVLGTGLPGALYMVLIGSTTVGFVLAVTLTSVANVVFIFATMPIFAATFSWIFLKEPISRRMILTMGAVLIGLGIIAYGSGTSDIASWQGDLWALFVTAAYAGALTAVRKVRDTSMVPAIPIAYMGAALVLSFFTAPLPSFAGAWPLIIAHGACIGAGSCLLALGPRYISSAEVSLLVLLESVLAPVLVWIVIGEDPGALALIGGAVVIGALVISNLVALRHRRYQRA